MLDSNFIISSSSKVWISNSSLNREKTFLLFRIIFNPQLDRFFIFFKRFYFTFVINNFSFRSNFIKRSTRNSLRILIISLYQFLPRINKSSKLKEKYHGFSSNHNDHFHFFLFDLKMIRQEFISYRSTQNSYSHHFYKINNTNSRRYFIHL